MLFGKKQSTYLTPSDFTTDEDVSLIPIAYFHDRVCYWDTKKYRHLVISGRTGAGKSVMGTAILEGLTRMRCRHNLIYSVDIMRIERYFYSKMFIRFVEFTKDFPLLLEDMERRANEPCEETPQIFLIVEDVAETTYDLWVGLEQLCEKYDNIHLILLGQTFTYRTIPHQIIEDALPVMMGEIDDSQKTAIFGNDYPHNLTVNRAHKGECIIKYDDVYQNAQGFMPSKAFTEWFERK